MFAVLEAICIIDFSAFIWTISMHSQSAFPISYICNHIFFVKVYKTVYLQIRAVIYGAFF